jgi:hypothetical protein
LLFIIYGMMFLRCTAKNGISRVADPDLDLHYFRKPDPDPHQSEKLAPGPQ